MKSVSSLYASGLSCEDVGKLIGMSAEYVRDELIRLNIPRRSKGHKKPKAIPAWEEYFGPRTQRRGECILWRGSCDRGGYGNVAPCFAPGIFRAHRLSWLIAFGEFDLRLKVLHTCDTPRCVNPKHLFLGTQVDNIRDMCAKGRQRSGSRHGMGSPSRKLNDKQVVAMRLEREKRGTPYYQLAEKFGVSTMTVLRAVKGESWRNI